MRDGRWTINLIVSVFLATIFVLTSIKFSGYSSSGVLSLVLYMLMLIACIGFVATSLKMFNIGHVDYIEFDANANNSLSDLIIHTSKTAIDFDHKIRFYPLIDLRIIFNPLVTLALIYLFSVCTLYLTVGSDAITFMNYMFLLVQSFIIFFATLAIFMAMFQLPSIIKYLMIKTALSKSRFTSRPSFLKGKTAGHKPIVAPKDKNKVDLNERFEPALNAFSTPTGIRFKKLYASVVDLSYEIENVSKDFNIPSSNFADELALINEIVNVFYPTTIANCQKTFTNTTLTKDLQIAFQEKIERTIIYKIRSYEDSIKKINMQLLEMRLSPFDTSGIDKYVDQAHFLHHKISTNSGVMTNKHLIISQSVIKDLLPSLIKTWSLASSSEQKKKIEGQFEELISFLQGQLRALEVSDSSTKSLPLNQQLLSLDVSSDIGLTELDSKIGQNGQYIKILQDKWN
ncbi:MAG: hypothetical protein J6N72_06060 [Psychrobacter sp.]|nr:hypothetical protein [Psychrobacter sp.]